MSTAEDYCLARSRWLRLRPADSRWLVGLALAELPPKPPRNLPRHRRRWQDRLTDSLGRAVRQRYGNPIIVWLLLNVVVPVVVRLVIEWWLSRQQERTRET